MSLCIIDMRVCPYSLSLDALCMSWEALFPGLDLDSGLDWTLDWTHGLWLNSAFSEARPTSRCPSYSPSPMQELDFQYKCW